MRPHSTSCCILKFQGISAENTIAGSTGFPLGFSPAPAGQTLDGAHVALDPLHRDQAGAHPRVKRVK